MDFKFRNPDPNNLKKIGVGSITFTGPYKKKKKKLLVWLKSKPEILEKI